MKTRTRREAGKPPVLVANEVICAGKPDIENEHPGASYLAAMGAHPDIVTTSSPQMFGGLDAEPVEAPVQAPRTQPPILAQKMRIESGVGMSRQEMLSALERHLDRPIPHATEFYLIDKIDRMSGKSGRFIELQDLIESAAHPAQICPFRLGMVLGAAVRAGALEKLGAHVGRNGSYRITTLGKRYLEQAKAMRAALWKINPLMDIAEICAIVQMEGGDTLSEMVSKVADQDALEKRRRREEKRAAKKAGATSTGEGDTDDEADLTQQGAQHAPQRPIQMGVHTLWVGLLAPMQQTSFSESATTERP